MPLPGSRSQELQAAAPAWVGQPSSAAYVDSGIFADGLSSIIHVQQSEGCSRHSNKLCAHPGDHDDHKVLMGDLVVLKGGVVLEHLHGHAKDVSLFLLRTAVQQAVSAICANVIPCPGR